MRNYIINILLAVSLVLILILTYSIYSKDKTALNNLDNSLSSYKSYNENIFYNTSTGYRNIAYLEILQQKLPTLYNIYVGSNGSIYFTDDIQSISNTFSKQLLSDKVIGLYKGYSSKKYIFMSDNIYENTYSTLIHELGHFLDDYLGSVSSDKEFINLYNKYKDIYYPINNSNSLQHTTVNNKEFFATTFSEFILYPKKFELMYTDLYKFHLKTYNIFLGYNNKKTTIKDTIINKLYNLDIDNKYLKPGVIIYENIQ